MVGLACDPVLLSTSQLDTDVNVCVLLFQYTFVFFPSHSFFFTDQLKLLGLTGTASTCLPQYYRGFSLTIYLFTA